MLEGPSRGDIGQAEGVPKWPRVGGVLALATVYFVVGKLSLLLAIPPGYATAVWPPAGVAVAALLVYGRGLWPGVVLGSFLVNVGTSFDATSAWSIAKSLAAAAGIGAGASGQAILGAYLVRRFVPPPLELLRECDILRFLVLGGPVACLVNASVGVGVLLSAGVIGPAAVPFSWWTWWVGDTIGVAVAAPFVLVWIGRPRDLWRRRRLAVGGLLAATFAVVVAFFVRASAWEEARIASEFQSQAKTISGAVAKDVATSLEVLHAVESLYRSSDEVRRDEFKSFVEPFVSRHPNIEAISWNRAVPGAERSAVEEAARREVRPDFQFTEHDGTGRRVRASERDEYVVVTYVEPAAGNGSALGFDVASEAVRAEALRRAAASRQPAATAPVPLLREKARQSGVLVFLPVYGAAESARAAAAPRVTGYVTGVLRLGDLVESALRNIPRTGIVTVIRDEGAPRGQSVLFADAGDADAEPRRGELRTRSDLEVAGRAWSVECRSEPLYLTGAATWRAWTILATGLLFVAVLGAFFLSMTGRAIVIERLGQERVAELARANETLAREVSERRSVEAALDRKEVELRQSQKMEAVGRLAGGVAHDFNNLLTVISGYGDMALASGDLSPRARSWVEQIVNAGKRATGLTRQLLAFGRKQMLRPEVLDPVEVLAGMERLLRPLIGEDVELRFSHGADVGQVHADRGQIEQVVLNLVVNARDAMPDGGTLTIGAHEAVIEDDASGAPVGAAPGRYAVISVTDTGVGMSPEVRTRLFEPFFTTKEPGKGTGLGLATVYGIVKQSGGHVEVESEPGRGACFRVYMPRIDAAVPPSGRGAPVPVPRGRETILFAEDDDAVRGFAAEVLARAGYDVLAAATPAEALRIAAEHTRRIDLVLTDTVMPGMNGRQLVDELRSRGADVVALFTSGYSDDAIVRHGVLDPGIAFLGKPFSPSELLTKVREVLDSVPRGADARTTHPGRGRASGRA